jgi:hypothetical protein
MDFSPTVNVEPQPTPIDIPSWTWSAMYDPAAWPTTDATAASSTGAVATSAPPRSNARFNRRSRATCTPPRASMRMWTTPLSRAAASSRMTFDRR